MKIELLKAFEDNTWDTETFEIPDSYLKIKDDEECLDTDENIYRFIDEELRGQVQYRKVVYWGIYNYSPDLTERDD